MDRSKKPFAKNKGLKVSGSMKPGEKGRAHGRNNAIDLLNFGSQVEAMRALGVPQEDIAKKLREMRPEGCELRINESTVRRWLMKLDGQRSNARLDAERRAANAKAKVAVAAAEAHRQEISRDLECINAAREWQFAAMHGWMINGDGTKTKLTDARVRTDNARGLVATVAKRVELTGGKTLSDAEREALQGVAKFGEKIAEVSEAVFGPENSSRTARLRVINGGDGNDDGNGNGADYANGNGNGAAKSNGAHG